MRRVDLTRERGESDGDVVDGGADRDAEQLVVVRAARLRHQAAHALARRVVVEGGRVVGELVADTRLEAREHRRRYQPARAVGAGTFSHLPGILTLARCRRTRSGLAGRGVVRLGGRIGGRMELLVDAGTEPRPERLAQLAERRLLHAAEAAEALEQEAPPPRADTGELVEAAHQGFLLSPTAVA